MIDWSHRFWSKVHPEALSGCWLWHGGLMGGGYGRVGHAGKAAHRIALTLVGVSVAGQVVRHRCDVRACVNPDHLLVGTQAQNIQDMHERGRAVIPCGDAHGRSRLTAEIVGMARVAYNAGASTRGLADLHGVGLATMEFALFGRTWKSVATPPATPRSRGPVPS